jgi:hypothetical protein
MVFHGRVVLRNLLVPVIIRALAKETAFQQFHLANCAHLMFQDILMRKIFPRLGDQFVRERRGWEPGSIQ